nr:transposon TX1 [Tanacetum cinerariifolium]
MRNINMDRKEMDNNIWQPLYNGMKWRERGTVLHDSHRKGKEDGVNQNESVGKCKGGRIIEIGEKEFNSEVINRSMIEEVKKVCYLPKLHAFCEEQGLNKVEVKLLGGLE